MVEYSQGIKAISMPTKRLEKLALEGRLRHGNNPVLRWMNRNVVIWRDANENIKMLKGNRINKIDGMVSLAMGIGLGMNNDWANTSSVGIFNLEM
jgi:phage terminase large subunit-like protein